MSSTVTAHSLQPHHAFHSTLSTTFTLDPPGLDCSFFALYTFPQGIIIDKHELIDRRLSFEFWGESDLELPVFALDQSANSLLLINATPTGAHPKKVTADIPVHARYGEPGTSPYTITIHSPVCFWACPPSGAYDIQNISPRFQVASASAPSGFSSEPPVVNSTMLNLFTHFSVSSASSHYALLQVPVASKRDLFSVEVGTATIILTAFLWLVYRSWRVAIALQSCHLKEQ